jgi:hypothetical protein
MSNKRASPASSASVCSLAGNIAKSVHENWCGWRCQTGCIQFRIGTIHREPDGQRIWLVIGGCTVEFLELLLEMDVASRERSVGRLSGQLRQFVQTQVWSVPQ